MAKVISGKEISDQIKQSIKAYIEKLSGRKPGLAVIIAGDDAASQVYVSNKIKDCNLVGIESFNYVMPFDVSEEEMIKTIKFLNNDVSIDGILVQLPLPKHLNEKVILNTIARNKDVDGFGIESAGLLSLGTPNFVACTPLGVLKMLWASNIDIEGKHAVVVGRSNIVGKPMAQLLLMNNATVTICHSRTKDIKSITKQADILIVAIGKAGFITQDMVKEGATVIDVGMNRVDGKLMGDVDFESVKDVCEYITPVPGGVGLMTRAMLLYNTIKAYEYNESTEIPFSL